MLAIDGEIKRGWPYDLITQSEIDHLGPKAKLEQEFKESKPTL
jgi:hypothetical protein